MRKLHRWGRPTSCGALKVTNGQTVRLLAGELVRCLHQMLAGVATTAAEGDETVRMNEIAEYEHPGDYVVIPIPVRDRIMARLNIAESRVKELQNEIQELKRKRAVKPRGHDVAEYYPPDGPSVNGEEGTT